MSCTFVVIIQWKKIIIRHWYPMRAKRKHVCKHPVCICLCHCFNIICRTLTIVIVQLFNQLCIDWTLANSNCMVVLPLLNYIYYAPTPLLNYRYVLQPGRSQISEWGWAVTGVWGRSLPCSNNSHFFLQK